jgi:formate hydrogenlyase subunit 4
MDTGSAFEGMGAAREMMISAIAEPALLLIWVALAITTGETSIQRMLGADLGTAWQTAAGPAVAMLTAAWFLLLLAENNRMPVDDPTTHLELTMVHEVMILDHSGPDLAYLTYASALKIWVFAALMVSTVTAMVTGPAWVDLLLFGGGMVLVALLVAAAESTMARLRMVRVPQLLMLAVALGTMSGVIALGVR